MPSEVAGPRASPPVGRLGERESSPRSIVRSSTSSDHREQQCLPVGKVPVQGADADASSLGDRVPDGSPPISRIRSIAASRSRRRFRPSVGPHRSGSQNSPRCHPSKRSIFLRLHGRVPMRSEDAVQDQERAACNEVDRTMRSQSRATRPYVPVTFERCDHVEGPLLPRHEDRFRRRRSARTHVPTRHSMASAGELVGIRPVEWSDSYKVGGSGEGERQAGPAGNLNQTVVPPVGGDVTPTSPPMAPTRSRTMARPSPLPDSARTGWSFAR